MRTIRRAMLSIEFFLFLAVAWSQPLDDGQATALQTFLQALGCTNTSCPVVRADRLCVDPRLACAGGLVTSLSITKARLSGSLHAASLAQLTGLELLLLHENSLNGTLPTTLGALTLLTDLRLYQNAIDGPLVSQIGRLTRLRALGLGAMRLQGTIPATFGALTALTGIDLNWNEFDEAPLPTLIGLWTALSHFACNGCRLVSTLPPQLAALSRLTFLELRLNKLNGTLPSFSGLTALKQLVLEENEFTGATPALPTSLTSCQLQKNSPAERSCLACRTDINCGCFPRSCAAPTAAPPTSPPIVVETGIIITQSTAARASTSTSASVSTSASTSVSTTLAATNGSVAASEATTTTTNDATTTTIGLKDTVASVGVGPEPSTAPMGAIIGGAIGGALALLVVILVVVLLVRKRRTMPVSAAATDETFSSFKSPTAEYASPGTAIFKPVTPITYTSLGSPASVYATGNIDAPVAPAPNKALYTQAPTLAAPPHMPPRESERVHMYQEAPAPEHIEHMYQEAPAPQHVANLYH